MIAALLLCMLQKHASCCDCGRGEGAGLGLRHAYAVHASGLELKGQRPTRFCVSPTLEVCLGRVQDFFQVLKPGLQLLRPPKKDARDGAGIVAGFVGYNYDAFKQEFGIEPWQVILQPWPVASLPQICSCA